MAEETIVDQIVPMASLESISEQKNKEKKMGMYWDKDSLKGKYLFLKKRKQKLRNRTILYFLITLMMFLCFIASTSLNVSYYYENITPTELQIIFGTITILFFLLSCYLFFSLESNSFSLKKIICPKCLKAVIIKELDFNCPYCDKRYAEKISGSDTVEVALFDKCSKCDGIIRKFECPKCGKYIDSFFSYDEKKLENRRYGE